MKTCYVDSFTKAKVYVWSARCPPVQSSIVMLSLHWMKIPSSLLHLENQWQLSFASYEIESALIVHRHNAASDRDSIPLRELHL